MPPPKGRFNIKDDKPEVPSEELVRSTSQLQNANWILPSFLLSSDIATNAITTPIQIQLRRNTQNGKLIAVKKIALDVKTKKWLRELAIANFKISHPNIVMYHSCAPSILHYHQDPQQLQRQQQSSPLSLSGSQQQQQRTFTSSSNSVFSNLSSSSNSVVDANNNNNKFSQSRSSSSSFDETKSAHIELTMEFAERLCLTKFTEDIVRLIESRRTRFMKRLINNSNSSLSSSSAPPPPSPTQAEFNEAKELAFSGLEPMIETCLKSVARQTLIGLVTFHEWHHTLHRDIKPSNCLIFENGFVKLADFDAAIPIPAENDSMTIAGTQKFLAPELRRECTSSGMNTASTKQLDKKKTDVFSLGISLIFCKIDLKYGSDQAHWPEWVKTLNQKLNQRVIGDGASETTTSINKTTKPSASSSFQTDLNKAIKELFADTGLKYLMHIMTKINHAERYSAVSCLAWTFVLDADACKITVEEQARQRASSQQVASSSSSSVYHRNSQNKNQPQQENAGVGNSNTSVLFNPNAGWQHMTQNQRNLDAEDELKTRFGIATCDSCLVMNDDHQSQKPKTFTDLVNRVHAVENALTKEAVQISLLLKSFASTAARSTTSASSPSNNLDAFQSLMNHKVLLTRQIDEVEKMKEIIAIVPPSSKMS